MNGDVEVTEKKTVFSSTLVSPIFLFICFLITLIILTVIVFRWTQFFSPHEQRVPLQHLTAEKIKEFGGDPIKVNVGLYIENFDKFDINNDEFIFSGILTFEFDPSLISLESLKKVSFDRGEVLYISAPTTQLEHERLFARYNVRIKLSANLDYAWFPFEDHLLQIVLEDKMLSPRDLVFATTNSDFIAPDMGAVGWHQFGRSAEAGYLEAPLQQSVIQYPAAVFAINYGRYTNVRNIFTIIFPMLMLFFIALFSLIIDPRENFTFVLTIPVTVIAGLISFRFIIEAMSPKVGYFLYSDYFFFLFLFLVFSILLFHTFGSKLGGFIRKLLIIMFNVIVVVFLIYLLSSAATK